MTTPTRKAALQWLHDHGEFPLGRRDDAKPSSAMLTRMKYAGEMQEEQRGGTIWLFLTDLGRQRLHEA